MSNLNRIKEIIGNQKPIRVFLDMDGVLADFEGSVNNNTLVKQYQKELDHLLSKIPDLRNLSKDELKLVLRGKQTDIKLGEIKKIFKKLNTQIFKLAGEKNFFINLNKLNGADQLVDGVIELLNGELPNILTAPMTSNPYCAEEKKNVD